MVKHITEEMRAYDALPFMDDLFNPTLEALHTHGGSATNAQIEAHVRSQFEIGPDIVGRLNVKKELASRLAWTRTTLKRYGVIENSRRGVWALTNWGRSVREVDSYDVRAYDVSRDKRHSYEYDRQLHEASTRRPGDSVIMESLTDKDLQVVGSLIGDDVWRETLLVSLLTMSPRAFQHLCLRFLSEHGFTDGEVSGTTRSDGGFYGYVTVEWEDLGKHRVPFLVKRYRGKVNSVVVNEFRETLASGSLIGIVITTGSFAETARREAIKEGEASIVMIDGETFLEKVRRLGWGVKTTGNVVEVDTYYFDHYHLIY